MQKIKKLIEEVINEEKIIYGVLSKVRNKGIDDFSKITLDPVLIKDTRMTQFTYHYEKNVTHNNLDKNQAIDEIISLFNGYFRQGVFFTLDADYQILISKKGKATILKKKPTRSKVDLSHDKKKNYIIEENNPCDFLIRLGVMNQSGKVFSKKYDQFRQINRFLEMVADSIPNIQKGKKFKIIDFGCAKAYLTFALYYYLVDILNLDVDIIGLDLKRDVIKFCNNVAKDLNYKNLRFIQGNIKDFDEFNNVNMVITLHACDTATDDALGKAINWDADLILSVPCCQHELFSKIDNPIMNPMQKHGIIKERLSSLITDSIRANVLEIMGYKTQMLEFISLEHTPKNILIRAVKKNSVNTDSIKEYIKFKEFWNIDNPYIEKAIGDRLKQKI